MVVLTGALCAAALIVSRPGSAQLAALDTAADDADARASLRPVGQGMARGEATFTETDSGLEVVVMMTGLEPGHHGIHIHELGDCSGPADSVAGDHFNPGDTPHGSPDAEADARHAGDFGNLLADSSGRARLELVRDNLGIDGDHGVVGRAIIVHQGRDDLRSQPSGESGDAVACGVIEKG